MVYNEADINLIVNEILQKIKKGEGLKGENSLNGVFDDMEKAIAAAKQSQKVIRDMSIAQREKIISIIRRMTREKAQLFAEMGVQETGMGNVAHKIAKHHLVADKTPGTEDIVTTAWSGDNGLTLVEHGPYGVIGAITPSTNPSETVICNTIGMLAAGNSVVFNPHPGAKNVSNLAVDLVNRASMETGGPNNIAVAVSNPTLETSGITMKHNDIPLLVCTGGPGVVTAVLKSGKRGIGAGAGNPPVLVDETADIKAAAEHIVNGATFDNNLPCIAEKEIIAVYKIYDELVYYLRENGCYWIDANKVLELENLVLSSKDGKRFLNRNCVGKDARTLLSMIGINAPENIRCIIFEANKGDLIVEEELMMPILGIIKVNNVDEGIDLAVHFEQGNRHSAHMHSKNVDNLTRYGKAVDTAIFVKNGPSYSALGYGGEGFTTFSIASRTGEGLTSAITFTKSRRCVLNESLCIR